MADNASLYSGIDMEYVSRIKELCKKADIICPNIYEDFGDGQAKDTDNGQTGTGSKKNETRNNGRDTHGSGSGKSGNGKSGSKGKKKRKQKDKRRHADYGSARRFDRNDITNRGVQAIFYSHLEHLRASAAARFSVTAVTHRLPPHQQYGGITHHFFYSCRLFHNIYPLVDSFVGR